MVEGAPGTRNRIQNVKVLFPVVEGKVVYQGFLVNFWIRRGNILLKGPRGRDRERGRTERRLGHSKRLSL